MNEPAYKEVKPAIVRNMHLPQRSKHKGAGGSVDRRVSRDDSFWNHLLWGCLLQAACSPCPPGHFCSSTGLTSPSGTCHTGFFCLGGALDPQGLLREQTGGPCPTGTWGPEEEKRASQRSQHPRMGSLGLKYRSSSLPGHFCPAGTANPQPCPAGTHSELTAQGHCMPCPQG